MASLPKNAHVSQHPCLLAKLSQLRSASTSSKDVQSLVHDIALMVGYEALAQGLRSQNQGTVRITVCRTPYPYIRRCNCACVAPVDAGLLPTFTVSSPTPVQSPASTTHDNMHPYIES